MGDDASDDAVRSRTARIVVRCIGGLSRSGT
jgi:protein-tyrosine phosphatase